MARKEVNNNVIETAINTEPFTMEWPKELDIQPVFTVKVTPTRSALVYEDKQLTAHQPGTDIVERNGYRVVFVITKTSLPPMTDGVEAWNYNRGRVGEFYASLLDVRLALQAYSIANRPKTKTVTQKVKVEVNGDEEY